MPASTMTAMGWSFVLRSRKKLSAKMPIMRQFVCVGTIVRPPQKAFSRIVTPADAIIATTAGRREPSTLCKTDRFRYLR